MRNQPTYLHDVYEFSGTPYEIGFQRGKMFAKRIKESLEGLSFGNSYYKENWPKPENYNLDYFKKNHPSLFKKWEKTMDKAPDWLKEEAHGQADGAGVSFEKLIIAGNWLPFIVPVKNNPEPKTNGELYEDCNGFIAYGKATSDGKPILAGNGEASHKGASGLRIVRMKNEVGNSFVAEAKLCESSAQALATRGLNTVQSGMNEKGVCIFGSGVAIKPEEYGDLGFILMMDRIILQEANNVDEAIDILNEFPRSPGGSHKYIADPKRAIHIESTGKRMNIIEPES